MTREEYEEQYAATSSFSLVWLRKNGIRAVPDGKGGWSMKSLGVTEEERLQAQEAVRP